MNPLLNIGSILFLIGGAADALIGAATPFVTRMKPLPLDALLLAPDSDRALFGDSPRHLLATSPALEHFYRLTLDWIGSLLLIFGLSVVIISWFGLRNGQWWALAALVVLDLVFFAGHALMYSTYLKAGAPIAATTAPPNLWIPALLFVPAAVLSYLGLQG